MSSTQITTDPATVKGIDHIEFWVGNAKQAAYYWKHWGFRPLAYAGLETGDRRRASWVMQQEKIRFVLTSAYSPHDELAAHHMIHGDGVGVVALAVDDVAAAHDTAVLHGARSVQAPVETADASGVLHSASIQAYGHTVLKFVDRSDYRGVFAPGYRAAPDSRPIPIGLFAVDHVVGNVEQGKMNHWANWFEQTLRFKQVLHFDDKTIHTHYSALMSKVMASGNGRVRFPIN